jgi:hypothetical protein
MLPEDGDVRERKLADESLTGDQTPNTFDSALDGPNNYKENVAVRNCAHLRGDVYPSTTSWISVAVLIVAVVQNSNRPSKVKSVSRPGPFRSGIPVDAHPSTC